VPRLAQPSAMTLEVIDPQLRLADSDHDGAVQGAPRRPWPSARATGSTVLVAVALKTPKATRTVLRTRGIGSRQRSFFFIQGCTGRRS
jgi:hypothetical protein